jgi:predicted DCC family thiol-disulfide oxidoreductase YuxK
MASSASTFAGETVTAPTTLTVLFDERCAFCLRCRDWLAAQPCLVRVELLPAGSPETRARFGEMPWLGSELVVADERGEAWIGPAAFLVCLWAAARYRPWSYLLSRPGFSGQAERFFMHVSKRRDRWGAWLTRKDPECSYCDDLGTRWDA